VLALSHSFSGRSSLDALSPNYLLAETVLIEGTHPRADLAGSLAPLTNRGDWNRVMLSFHGREPHPGKKGIGCRRHRGEGKEESDLHPLLSLYLPPTFSKVGF